MCMLLAGSQKPRLVTGNYLNCSLVPRLPFPHVCTNFMHMTFHLVSRGGAWYIWARERCDRWTSFDARATGWTPLMLELRGVMQGHYSVVEAKE